jgi:DNA-binding XRE family transcriptional regulator
VSILSIGDAVNRGKPYCAHLYLSSIFQVNIENMAIRLALTCVIRYFVIMSDGTRPVKPDKDLLQDRRRLRRRRQLAGLGVREAAALSDVSAGYISFLEIGRRSASPTVLRKLAQVYGCTVADIIRPEPAAEDDEQEPEAA